MRKYSPTLFIITLATLFLMTAKGNATDTSPAIQLTNLLPPVTVQSEPGLHWQLVHTADSRVKAGLDRTIEHQAGQSSLHLESEGDTGYAEWRVVPQIKLAPGKTYHFSVWVKNRSISKPYFQAYAFYANKKPHLFAGIYGRSGHNGWYLMQTKLVVPKGAKTVRLGMGLSHSRGDAWFCQPKLVKQVKQELSHSAKKTVTKSHSAKSSPSISSPKPIGRKWKADWIWIKHDPGVPSVVFSKTVHLDSVPAAAIFQVTADNDYRLRINGNFIGEDTNWHTVERYKVASYLHAGDNQIQVTVANYGGAGGLILQGVLIGKDGHRQVIATNQSWSARAPSPVGQAKVAVLGLPPVKPWGALPLASFQPPQIVTLSNIQSPKQLRAGQVFRLLFKPPHTLNPDEIKALQCQFYRNGKQCALSAYSLRVVARQDSSILLELPTSAYAVPGNYHWQLEGIQNQFVPAHKRRAHFILTAGRTPPAITPSVWKKRSDVIQTASGPQSPFTYCTATPSAASFIHWQVTGGHMYEVPARMSSLWKPDRQWNFVPIVRELMQILQADPKASVYLRVSVDMPSWWLVAHPNDRFKSNKGRLGLQSFASDAWRHEAVLGIMQLVKALRKQPVGRCIAGVIPMGFQGGEFQLWGESQGEYDVSPIAIQRFDQWQHAQGISKPNLIKLPNPALSIPFPPGAKNAHVRQLFFKFVAERQAQNLVYIAKGIKKNLDKPISVAFYFGYVLEHANNLKRMLFSGGLDIGRVIRHAPIDMLCSPASYTLRGSDKPMAFMYPFGSAALHGIFPLIEDDVRNYRTPYSADSSGHTLESIIESFQSMKKLRLLAAAHGAGVRYLALLRTVDFFQAPPILTEIAKLNRLVMSLKPIKFGQDGQIALVLNPMAYTAAVGLPDAASMTKKYLSQIRNVLARTGRPYTYILFDDWAKRSKLWNTVVVPLPSLLSNKKQHALAKAFGPLPAIRPSDGLLILSRAIHPHAEIVSNLKKAWKVLSTSVAQKAGFDTIWYVGGNFTAKYTNNGIHLNP